MTSDFLEHRAVHVAGLRRVRHNEGAFRRPAGLNLFDGFFDVIGVVIGMNLGEQTRVFRIKFAELPVQRPKCFYRQFLERENITEERRGDF